MNIVPQPRVLDDNRRAEIAEMIQTLMTSLDTHIQRGNSQFVGPVEIIYAFCEQHADVFAFDRKWYTPLLATQQGLAILAKLLYDDPFVVDDYDDDVNLEQLMRSYLHLQFLLADQSTRTGDELPNYMLILLSFPRSLFKALCHYLHPDQAPAFAQLKASAPLLPPALTHPQQCSVPPEALPLLFPNIDTTQFAPQFDWFIYLLSQFSSVDEKTYTANFSSLLDTISHPTQLLSLKPGLTLDKVFTHNHLINSYDEFLHSKLPQALPTVQPENHSPPTNTNRLFPYLPDQHPLLPSIASKAEFSALLSNPTNDFMTYFNYMFILGPWIQATADLPGCVFSCDWFVLPPSASTNLAVHKYRAGHLETIHPSSSSTVVPIINDTNNLQPPDFTASPFDLVSLTGCDSCVTTYPRFLFLILSHYFPNEAICDTLDKHLASRLTYYPSEGLCQFSSTLSQNGYITLHQHVHRLLLNTNTNMDGMDMDRLKEFLLSPLRVFGHCDVDSNESAQHIALCIHAGFLAPQFPLSPTTDVKQHVFLSTLRSTLLAALVRFTGFISYFPQSTQLLATAVSTAASRIDLSALNLLWSTIKFHQHHFPLFFPPHLSIIHDPRDTDPSLKAALVGDEGKLYAIKYAANDADEGGNGAKLGWVASNFPFQSAPRYKHIFHGAAIDDLRACITYDEHELRQYQELLHAVSNANFRSGISDDDMAWIKSEDNQKDLNLYETRELQKKLTAYYRQVNQVETDMVTTQMHKVLNKAYDAGVFDASNTGQKRKRPPPSAHDAAPPTELASNATPPSSLLAHNRTYPLPNLPQIPNMVQGLNSNLHDTTFTKQRGVLHQTEDGDTVFFYDHNHVATSLTGDFVSSMSTGASSDCLNAEGRLKTDGTASVVDYFRQRSEWALELLMMSCFGLDAASTQKSRPQRVSTQEPTLPAPGVHTYPSFQSLKSHTQQVHIQQSKDHILQHLPIHLNGLLQPTPTIPPRSYLEHRHGPVPNQNRLCYYYEMMTQFDLLVLLPLFSTLASLSPTSPSP